MLSWLDRFSQQGILILGDVMLDEFIFGSVQRISPEAPVPVVTVTQRKSLPGGAANTAANVASLGGRAELIGLIGADLHADSLRSLLDRLQVGHAGLLTDRSRVTTTKTRIIAQTQQVVRIDEESSLPPSPELEDAILDRFSQKLKQAQVAILSDYGKGLVSPRVAQGCIERCRAAGRPLIVDPKGIAYEKYRGAYLVKPNLLEAGRVLNRELITTDDVDQAGRDLQSFLGADSNVLITRGAQGMTLYTAEQERFHTPALAREVYDVTGAGDTVAATLALGLASGGPIAEACRLAAVAAAVVVGKLGTATCSPDELRQAVQQRVFHA